MKTFTSIILALCMTFTLAAEPKCERLAFYDMDNLRSSFERDLVSNVWRTSMLGPLSTLYFQEDGLVIAVPATLEKIHTYMWSLAMDEGRAILTFLSPTVEKKFMIAPTCSGISAMSQGRSTTMTVSDAAQISDSEMEFVETQLVGTWYYQIGKSKKARPVSFSLSLNQDGSFDLKTDPDSFHSVNEGVWQLSADGKYLMLYTKVLIGTNEQFVAEAISLKSVDFEDMVIDARTLPRALAAYNSKEPLYLSKARA